MPRRCPVGAHFTFSKFFVLRPQRCFYKNSFYILLINSYSFHSNAQKVLSMPRAWMRTNFWKWLRDDCVLFRPTFGSTPICDFAWHLWIFRPSRKIRAENLYIFPVLMCPDLLWRPNSWQKGKIARSLILEASHVNPLTHPPTPNIAIPPRVRGIYFQKHKT